LEAMLLDDRSDLGVLDLDWRSLRRFLPNAATPKFSELIRAGGEGESEEDGVGDMRRLLAELPAEELQNTVVELLRAEIGEILRIAPDRIDASLSMQQMGLDSLMGVELVVAVENRFGTRLPVMALSDSPTIAKLAAWIITQLRGDEAASTDGGRAEARAQVERIALQQAAEVPAADLEFLADNLRAGTAANQRMIH